jgi:hypothetical protein
MGERNYKILAGTMEEFIMMKNGFEELIKHFELSGTPNVLVKHGLSPEARENIEVYPFVMGTIEEVAKRSSDLEWNLISSGKGIWRIRGKEHNYTIYREKTANLI